MSYETVYEDESVVTKRGRIEHFGQYGYLRVLGADSERILADAGFEVQVVCGVDCPDKIRPVIGFAYFDSPDTFFCWKR